MRSSERNQRELAYLQQKWGKWLSVKSGKATVRLLVNVSRRQNLVTVD